MNTGDSDLNVSIDGRRIAALSCGEECTVSVADKRLKMLTFSSDNMFATLFKKMRIMEDVK
jgi:NAD kinase